MPELNSTGIESYIDYMMKSKQQGNDVIIEKNVVDSKTLTTYEYAIEKISNTLTGKMQDNEVISVIQKYASEGWRVHTIYSNELGKNFIGVMGIGVNATQSEDVILFERQTQYNIISHSEKDLLITNYSEKLPIRFGVAKMVIPQNADVFYLYLSGKTLNDVMIDAIRVDVEFITMFDERIKGENYSFGINKKSDASFVTESYEVKMNKNEIKLIKSLKVYVKACVSGGKAITLNNIDYIDINENDVSIGVKKLYGADYVGSFEQTENTWKCVCGKINSKSDNVCPACKRKLNELSEKKAIDSNLVLGNISEMESAKEIYEYIMKVVEETKDEKMILLSHELVKTAEIERMYGNKKQAAIKLVNECLKSM